MTGALFRTTRDLTHQDKEQVLRFAEFLRNAGLAPLDHDRRTERRRDDVP